MKTAFAIGILKRSKGLLRIKNNNHGALWTSSLDLQLINLRAGSITGGGNMCIENSLKGYSRFPVIGDGFCMIHSFLCSVNNGSYIPISNETPQMKESTKKYNR